MLIVVIATLVVLVVVGVHSSTRVNAPREDFYIDLDEE